MFSKAFIATLLASTVAASPVVARADGEAFSLLSIRSGTDLQNQVITANGGALWIGKESSANPAGSSTNFNAGNGGLFLDVAVPGGQQVYIAPSSAVSFTQPHSANTQGGKTQGWTYTAGKDGGFGSLSFPDYGFIACASTEGAGIYQIFATPGGSSTGNCTGIAVATVPYSGASAFEYY
ncbi:hypothetical protein MFRU_043g00520 [Monilinia fructicola]|uniref:Cell wall protein PhiA n=1 Tax=Monilinia fructicola TaxID=38448 RepID=A0A5M9J8T8_MONFR|nr:hypothetical protein EYC84_011206 [Monilinia fructicola]KAG4026248.1 hypothetical protein MFRU_043g00520 [Monilinia fructicola]